MPAEYPAAMAPRLTLHLHPDATAERHTSWALLTFKVIGLLAVGVGLYLLFHFVLEPYINSAEAFVESLGLWGPLLFIGLFLVLTSLFVPESILAIAAGAIFGLWWGLLWVFVAGTITATFIFLIGRTMLRSRAEKLLARHPKINAIDTAASNAGFRLLLLLRLSPLNYSLLCYLIAVSRARLKPYLLSCIGMAPGNFSTVYVGFAAKHSADLARKLKEHGGHLPAGDSMVHEVTLYLGLAAAIIASLVVTRIAMKAIREATQQTASTS